MGKRQFQAPPKLSRQMEVSRKYRQQQQLSPSREERARELIEKKRREIQEGQLNLSIDFRIIDFGLLTTAFMLVQREILSPYAFAVIVFWVCVDFKKE